MARLRAWTVALTALAFSVASSPGASAAPPLPPAAVDWTGFYVGGNFGIGFGSVRESTDGTNASFTRLAPAGAIAGGQAGYRFQHNWLVVGAETDFQGSTQNSSSCIFATRAGCLPIFNTSRTSSLDWFGTVRGVAGVANGNSLWYVTGGYAYGNVLDEAGGLQLGLSQNGSGLLLAVASERKTLQGWSVGTGVETLLGASNWSLKLEYLYVNLGRHTLQPQCAGGLVNALGNIPVCADGPTSVASPVNMDFTDNIVRVGLNYKIGAQPAAMPAPAAAPANWAGFYVGGNFGYGAGHDRIDVDRIPNSGIPSQRFSFPQTPGGVIGGGQAGYRFQHDWRVMGVEADFQWSNQKDGSCAACVNVPVNFDVKRDWFGTVRGVAGVANGNWLWYVTGGYAYGRVELHQEVSFFFANDNAILGSSRTTQSGWTVGTGVETKLGASNWSAKLEYLYVNLGDVSFYGTCSTIAAGRLALRPGPCIGDQSSMADHIVRFGLNYRLGG